MVYLRAGNLFAPLVSAAWIALFTLAILKIRALERGDRMFWERRALLLIVTDLAAIVTAYLGAYFLRMNFQFTQAEGMAVLRALPIVVVVRSACFFKYGLYRSMWRYTSVADVVRVIKAVTAGSAIILAAVVLLYRFVAFPRTLFLIEYFLLIVLILGVRFSTRLFHEIGREPHGGLRAPLRHHRRGRRRRALRARASTRWVRRARWCASSTTTRRGSDCCCTVSRWRDRRSDWATRAHAIASTRSPTVSRRPTTPPRRAGWHRRGTRDCRSNTCPEPACMSRPR